jgi:anti-anti-sigma factor
LSNPPDVESAVHSDGSLPEPLQLAIRTTDSGRVHVVVDGELDLASADTLHEALERELAAGNRVLLDLSGVTFIDSTGLAAIVNAVNSARESDGELELCAELHPQARRLMELTGVLPLFSLVDGDRR